jgi:hypothetical protein
MTKLLDILLEKDNDYRFRKKESIKKTFHSYSCVFLVKFKRKVNRVQAVERVRGIPTVTIVDLRGDEKLDKINRTLKDYEYSTVEVKFITNRDPKKHLNFIKHAMVRSDKEKGLNNIPGIVAATPKLDTLVKTD